MNNLGSDLRASPTLYQHVRADFVRRGLTLNAWCRANGVTHGTARKALIGEWTGPKASVLVARIVAASRGRDAA